MPEIMLGRIEISLIESLIMFKNELIKQKLISKDNQFEISLGSCRKATITIYFNFKSIFNNKILIRLVNKYCLREKLQSEDKTIWHIYL